MSDEGVNNQPHDGHLRLEKRLDLRNRITEKLLLGLILVGAGAWLAHYSERRLQEHHAQHAYTQFLLESRLKAITQLREIHSDMSSSRYMLTFEIPSDRRQ